MKIAAIDLGTNSFLCLIVTVDGGKIVKVHQDLTRIVRIGERVHETRMLQPSALERAEKCFAEFQKLISQQGCDRVLAVATSAARDVKNGSELIALGQKYGIPIKVISGEQEAMMTFAGMAFDRDNLNGILGIDIGGGSTEIIRQIAPNKVEGRSVDVGCVRLTELFISQNPVPESEVTKLRAYAKEKLSVFSRSNPREAIAVAGTPTALACVQRGIGFDAAAVHGTILTRKTIQSMTERLAKLSVEDRLKVPGLDRGRADVIVAGGIILDVVGEIIGADQFTVSVYGARYGLALAMESDKI